MSNPHERDVTERLPRLAGAPAGTASNRPLAIVVTGVSGAGKSTIGVLLATRIGGEFIDADDLHPAANRAKMSAGVPLSDDDRWPWLDAVGAAIAQRQAAGVAVVVACSALRRVYRDRLLAASRAQLCFVALSNDVELLRRRLAARRGHYMPTSLLSSQLATLERLGPDEPGFRVPNDVAPETVVDQIFVELERRALK